MADEMPGQAQPQQQPPQGQAPHQGGAPFGSSPATGPTQNKGQEAGAAKLLGVISDGCVAALQMVGANSESGKVLLDVIKKVAGLVPPGSVTAQDKIQVLQSLSMQAQKQGQQLQMMRQRQMQGGGQPGAPGAQPGQPGQPGAQPQHTPMPGAG